MVHILNIDRFVMKAHFKIGLFIALFINIQVAVASDSDSMAVSILQSRGCQSKVEFVSPENIEVDGTSYISKQAVAEGATIAWTISVKNSLVLLAVGAYSSTTARLLITKYTPALGDQPSLAGPYKSIFLKGFPLLPEPKNLLGLNTSKASYGMALASIAVYLQREKKIPLYVDLKLRHSPDGFSLPDEGNSWGNLSSQEMQKKEQLAIANAKSDGVYVYRDELRAAHRNDPEFLSRPVTAAWTATGWVSDGAIRRKHLKNPISPSDRYQAMDDEVSTLFLASQTEGAVLKEQVLAQVIGYEYFHEDVNAGVQEFFCSRGIGIKKMSNATNILPGTTVAVGKIGSNVVPIVGTMCDEGTGAIVYCVSEPLLCELKRSNSAKEVIVNQKDEMEAARKVVMKNIPIRRKSVEDNYVKLLSVMSPEKALEEKKRMERLYKISSDEEIEEQVKELCEKTIRVKTGASKLGSITFNVVSETMSSSGEVYIATKFNDPICYIGVDKLITSGNWWYKESTKE